MLNTMADFINIIDAKSNIENPNYMNLFSHHSYFILFPELKYFEEYELLQRKAIELCNKDSDFNEQLEFLNKTMLTACIYKRGFEFAIKYIALLKRLGIYNDSYRQIVVSDSSFRLADWFIFLCNNDFEDFREDEIDIVCELTGEYIKHRDIDVKKIKNKTVRGYAVNCLMIKIAERGVSKNVI